MVRLRSQRQVHFFRIFPLSSLLLLFFSFFPSSLVSPIWASPCIIRYFLSESTPGSKGKMRKGERRKVERDPFVSSWLSCPRSLFSIFLLSSHHRPQIYAGIHLQTMPNTSIASPSFIFRHRAISTHQGKMHRENRCELTGKNRTIRMRPRLRFRVSPVALPRLVKIYWPFGHCVSVFCARLFIFLSHRYSRESRVAW